MRIDGTQPFSFNNYSLSDQVSNNNFGLNLPKINAQFPFLADTNSIQQKVPDKRNFLFFLKNILPFGFAAALTFALGKTKPNNTNEESLKEAIRVHEGLSRAVKKQNALIDSWNKNLKKLYEVTAKSLESEAKAIRKQAVNDSNKLLNSFNKALSTGNFAKTYDAKLKNERLIHKWNFENKPVDKEEALKFMDQSMELDLAWNTMHHFEAAYNQGFNYIAYPLTNLDYKNTSKEIWDGSLQALRLRLRQNGYEILKACLTQRGELIVEFEPNKKANDSQFRREIPLQFKKYSEQPKDKSSLAEISLGEYSAKNNEGKMIDRETLAKDAEYN